MVINKKIFFLTFPNNFSKFENIIYFFSIQRIISILDHISQILTTIAINLLIPTFLVFL